VIGIGFAGAKPAVRTFDGCWGNDIDLAVLMGAQIIDEQIMLRFYAHQTVFDIRAQLHTLVIEGFKSKGSMGNGLISNNPSFFVQVDDVVLF